MKIDEPLKKILTYKIRRTEKICSKYTNAVKMKEKIDKEYTKIIDPDSESVCIQNIYKKLWDEKYYNECIKMDKNEHICGETMNTLFTTFNRFVRYIAFKDVYKKGNEKFNEREPLISRLLQNSFCKKAELLGVP